MFVRLYYVEESDSLMSQMSSQTTSLRQKLISLRQDEVENSSKIPILHRIPIILAEIKLQHSQVVRSSLEPVYGVFLKAGNEHPGNILQQCILSLL